MKLSVEAVIINMRICDTRLFPKSALELGVEKMPVDSSYNESGYIFMNLDRPFNYGTLTEYICSNVPVHTSFGNLLSNTWVSQKKFIGTKNGEISK